MTVCASATDNACVVTVRVASSSSASNDYNIAIRRRLFIIATIGIK